MSGVPAVPEALADDDRELLVATVAEILTAHPPQSLAGDVVCDDGLWQSLVSTELVGVGLPEAAGGSGGGPRDAAAVVGAVARGAGAVPLAEHLLVAAPSLLAAGLSLPDLSLPLSVALGGDASWEGDSCRLTGRTTESPWAGVAAAHVVLASSADGEVLALVSGTDAVTARNLAGEPSGTLDLAGLQVLQAARLDDAQAADVRARFATARAVQLSAALDQVLTWTIQHAGEREQFGKPLSAFQVIQAGLAGMAGEVAAAQAAADAAVLTLAGRPGTGLAAGVAKVRTGSAVEVVVRGAHQVHGALGFTQEHRLHHLTRRCWAWRDEAGPELEWSRHLGEQVLHHEGGLWAAITA